MNASIIWASYITSFTRCLPQTHFLMLAIGRLLVEHDIGDVRYCVEETSNDADACGGSDTAAAQGKQTGADSREICGSKRRSCDEQKTWRIGQQYRRYTRRQRCPPTRGALRPTAWQAVAIWVGDLQSDFNKWKADPPIMPVENPAPVKISPSSKISAVVSGLLSKTA
ncbi:hypothetical protein PIB30_025831 [Stylosanthes scabra]|uniref:Uncharacterized protein n=1 Tax=Stylosanthes scabra TaxID=79078 RepID=A0ABU6V8D5_9FABA|nr:hypothetical protein [Stylosanthes scabra]